MDQTLRQTARRFGPWLTGSLWLLLAIGILMVIAEPVRELVTFSFWLKMALVAISALVAVIFQAALRRHEPQWGDTRVHSPSIKRTGDPDLPHLALHHRPGTADRVGPRLGAWSPSTRQ